MKKIMMFLAVMVMVVFPVSFALADDTNIRAGATGGQATSTSNAEAASASSAAAGAESSNTTLRPHVSATTGVAAGFAGTPWFIPGLKGMQDFVCRQQFRIISVESIQNMLESGRFSDRPGSIWDAFFAQPIKPVIHKRGKGELDNKPIRRLDRLPNLEPTGEFTVQGYYGWPIGASIARALNDARLQTHTHNVYWWVEEVIDSKASSNMGGIGALTSKSDESASHSLGVTGAMGSTYASFQKRYDVQLWSFDDEEINAIDSRYADKVEQEVCFAPPLPPPQKPGPQIVINNYMPTPPPPKIEPRVEPKAECDPRGFIALIYDYAKKIAECWFPCLHNEGLRFGKGNANVDMYYCTGKKYPQFLLDAIGEYDIAERDFKNGHELAPGQKFGERPRGVATTTVKEAQDIMEKVRFNRNLATCALNGSYNGDGSDLKR